SGVKLFKAGTLSQGKGADNLGRLPPGGSCEPPLPPFIAAQGSGDDVNRPVAASADPGVMKQILLRVPAVFSKVPVREFSQPLRGHFPSTREIMLPQDALDPDIDRECSQPFIRKKHHAICNLRPHARQRAQLFSKLSIRKRQPRLEIRLAGADEPRRPAQVFSAIAKLALA